MRREQDWSGVPVVLSFVAGAATSAALCYYSLRPHRRHNEPGSSRKHWPWNRIRTRRQERSEAHVDRHGPSRKSGLCIGSIFGLDVGGSLAKLAYFEQAEDFNRSSASWDSEGRSSIHSQQGEDVLEETSQDDWAVHRSSQDPVGIKKSRSLLNMQHTSKDQVDALSHFYDFARHLDSGGFKDEKLTFYSRELGGYFHFVQFETRRMPNAMRLIRAHNLDKHIVEMGATGGGAHKYSSLWQEELGIAIRKYDELDSMVAGMQFVLSTVVGECYTFRPGTSSSTLGKSTSTDSADTMPMEEDDGQEHRSSDGWWWSRKVKRDAIANASCYPYLLVMIGTGVSILRVDGPRQHERVSGSTIGGGSYWGLMRLLTDLENFEDVMRLAERGDPSKVDMMVGDIYGEKIGALEKLGLRANLVASSFGKLVAKDDPAADVKEEDLARALLLMVTNNIGQVAYLNAQIHQTKRYVPEGAFRRCHPRPDAHRRFARIYFVGNFLRQNKISQRRLAFAIDYWSKGEMEALFLEHDGYYGALGAFLQNQGISHNDPRFWHQRSRSMYFDDSSSEFSGPGHIQRSKSIGGEFKNVLSNLFS